MTTQPQRIGVPTIELSLDSTTSVPSLASLTFAASAITPTDSLYNDSTPSLLTSEDYQVCIALVGRDTTNGGYTINAASPGSGIVNITTGQVIEITVDEANWPANYEVAVAAAVFLKVGSGSFQLAQFAYIPDGEDFSTVIKAKPIRTAPRFTFALLNSTTTDLILGDRAPLGVTYEEITPTTDTFNIVRRVDTVTVSPNNAPDYTIATTRAVSVQFQALSNDIKTIVRAAGGNYVQYSSGGLIHREAHSSKNTAQAIVRGNKPIRLTFPADEFGAGEVMLLVGQLAVNQVEFTEAWSKTATTPISFTFDAVATDRLTNSIDTEIKKYSR